MHSEYQAGTGNNCTQKSQILPYLCNTAVDTGVSTTCSRDLLLSLPMPTGQHQLPEEEMNTLLFSTTLVPKRFSQIGKQEFAGVGREEVTEN